MAKQNAAHDLDHLGRAEQQKTTKHGKPHSKLRGVCLCRQLPDGTLHVSADCPIHGSLGAGKRVSAGA
jgi:hypothetical protein